MGVGVPFAVGTWRFPGALGGQTSGFFFFCLFLISSDTPYSCHPSSTARFHVDALLACMGSSVGNYIDGSP